MKITGSCHCGNISYEAEIDPNRVVVCHCTDCQSLSATAFRTLVLVASNNLNIHGQVKIYIKVSDSGSRRQQAFCPNCGAGIYATSDEAAPETYNIRLGTCHERNELIPKKQFWTKSSLPWLEKLNSIPRDIQSS